MMMAEPVPHLSVVVPTYKRPELLERCLAALMTQHLDSTAYEIIVVDDGKDLQTQCLVNSWARRVRPILRYIPAAKTRGPAAARNTGWRAAQGEIIAFTDDDCLPEPGWLLAGAKAFTKGVSAAWGTLRMSVPTFPTDYELNAAQLATSPFVTANCFVRRDVLTAIGGFDERFTAPWREDSDLYFSLLESGHRVVTAPNAIVVHPVRPARWGVSLGQQRKSLFNALLYKKHPSLYRTYIQGAPPWLYYGIVAALLTGVGSVCTGNLGLSAGATGVWLALTAHFCRRRLRQTSHAPSHIAEMIVTSALIPLLSVFWRLFGAVKFRVLFF